MQKLTNFYLISYFIISVLISVCVFTLEIHLVVLVKEQFLFDALLSAHLEQVQKLLLCWLWGAKKWPSLFINSVIKNVSVFARSDQFTIYPMMNFFYSALNKKKKCATKIFKKNQTNFWIFILLQSLKKYSHVIIYQWK